MKELRLPSKMEKGDRDANSKDQRDSSTDTHSNGSTSPSTLEEKGGDSGDDDVSQFSPVSVS